MIERIRIPGLSRLGLDGPAHTAPLAILLILESGLIRGIMLNRAGSLLSVFDVVRALRSDALLALAAYLLFSALISASRGAFRIFSIVAYDVLIIVWLAALLVHAGLFSYFGTGLSKTYVEHWLQNFGPTTALLLNEIRGANVVWLLLQTAAIVACLTVPRMKRAKLRASGADGHQTRSMVGSSLAVLIALEMYSFVPSLADVHPAITVSPLRILLASEKRPLAVTTSVPDEFAIDGPLELERDPARPPLNVILVIFESLGWKSIDIFSQGLETTPFMKDLAEKGTLVPRVYTVLPHTSKALVSLLGGIYPYLEPEVKEAIPGMLPERGLAHILKKQGYRTAFFQTGNNYENRSQLVANLGYEVFKGLSDMPGEGFSVANYFGKEDRMMFQPCLDWIDSVRRVPFLLTVLTLSTHHDYNVPPSFAKRDHGLRDPMHEKYLNAVRYTDDFIRDFFHAVESRGLLENTLFIVLGDHGEAFEEHRGVRGHNMTLYEEGLRTVAVLYAPGHVRSGTIVEGYRSILDVTPTVCDILGLNIKRGHFTGLSFLTPAPENRKLYFSAWSRGYGLAERQGATKSIFWGIPDKTEVFENESDPDDKVDVARKTPEARRELQAAEDEAKRWADSICSQYLQREAAVSRGGIDAGAAPLANPVQAKWENAVTLTGYDMTPRERPPATSLWIKIAFQMDHLPKGPLEFYGRVTHANGASETRALAGFEVLGFDKLKPGARVTRDMFLPIPAGWPPGEALVEVGFRDKRSGRFLPAFTQAGQAGTIEWVSLGKITIILP